MVQKTAAGIYSFIKRSLLVLSVVVTFISCSKDDDDDIAPASNTLTFDSTFQNVSMTGAASGTKWQLNAVINLPSTGGFAKALALNVKFLQQPAVNATYSIVSTETDVTATTAMLYINYVDYNPSPVDNTSNSYFLKTGTTGNIDVSLVSGKVNIKFNGLTLTGNRGGGDKANISADITQN